SLTSIVISEGVSSIGEEAFAGCSSLTSIVIPESVAFINRAAFSRCKNLTIYCKANKKPAGWDKRWNKGWSLGDVGVKKVVWGAKGEN
ncbi:MAG: leucine-rich repeat domain-containing protein, partial [Clostridia bacterium]|nr:leucine-rich repeat domain-containing protein [Clostridia bacterium]